MPKTGRPPTPTKLKLLYGNPGKRRINKNEPQPTEGAPTRPEWLLPEAKHEWSRLVDELGPVGLLTKVDRAALAAYCQCWAMYVDAVKDIAENGTSFTTNKGYEGPRTSVGLMVKMLDKMAVYGAKFGFSPADRTRLTMPERQEDELDALLRSGS